MRHGGDRLLPQDDIERRLKLEARRLGFVRCGITSVEPLPHDDQLQRWLDDGMAGSMGFISRSRQLRAQPARLLSGSRSAIVVIADVSSPEGAPRSIGGQIARYAGGRDYHQVLRERLGALATWLQQQVDTQIATRAVVDTAPLLERELAMRAGVGFIGKNTMLITPGVGSHSVIGTLLTTLPLNADEPTSPRCGSCDLCLKSCPTEALVAPYRLDARRCISYLTIEQRGPIATELRSKLGNHLFGCDDCQDACPYNTPTTRRLAAERDADLAPPDALRSLGLVDLLRMRSGSYRRLVRGRALGRASRAMWQRNAALVAGNLPRSAGAAPCPLDDALDEAAQADHDLVAEAARWAREERRNR